MTPFIRETVKWVNDAGQDPTEFQWFDLSGAIGDMDRADTSRLMTHRPPFEKSFVVWRGKTRNHDLYELFMIVVGSDPEEGIAVTMWKGPSNQPPRAIPAMVYLIDGDTIRYGAVDEDAEMDKSEAELILAQVGAWYAALDRRMEAHQPVIAPTFTNRRKIAQGKLPAYDWRTVVIEPARSRQESKGGTHASPRLHDRRGHLRRLKSGKNVWVKPHKVGRADLGVIFHDYEVKGESIIHEH